MKAIIILFLVLHLSVACNQTPASKNESNETRLENQVEERKQIFIPDTSINNIIYLESPVSTVDMFGDIMSLLDRNKDLPCVYFESIGKTPEYIKLIVHPGSEINNVSEIEVGSSSTLSDSINLTPTDYSFFKTESGVKIGISKKELIAIKGDDFTNKQVDNQEVLSYKIDDFSSSSFLKKYNMPIYFAEYWFTNDDRLVKHKFGFEYP